MNTKDSVPSRSNKRRHNPGRRKALGCLAAWSGTALVWSLAGGMPRTLAATNLRAPVPADPYALSFVQISDTHIGFH